MNTRGAFNLNASIQIMARNSVGSSKNRTNVASSTSFCEEELVICDMIKRPKLSLGHIIRKAPLGLKTRADWWESSGYLFLEMRSLNLQIFYRATTSALSILVAVSGD